MVLSWWPFEEEAIRAIWESGHQLAYQEKELQAAKKEIEAFKKVSALALKAKDDALARSAPRLFVRLPQSNRCNRRNRRNRRNR
jgi:hypothetical protein